MNEWQKEMINIIMDANGSPSETVAELINGCYTGDPVYMDEIASSFTSINEMEAEILKDYFIQEVAERKEQ